MSVATALGLEYEVPNLAQRCASEDGAPHVGYASSHSSECALKGCPPSPDSPLLWAGGQYLRLPSSHCVADLRPEINSTWLLCVLLPAVDTTCSRMASWHGPM